MSQPRQEGFGGFGDTSVVLHRYCPDEGNLELALKWEWGGDKGWVEWKVSGPEGIACANALWSAGHLRGGEDSGVAWAQGEDAGQAGPYGLESQAEPGSRGRWGRERAWRGRLSSAREGGGPRLGGLERPICEDRGSASVGLCPPCLLGTGTSSADWWVVCPARAVPSQRLKGGSHELMSL